jgi:hypothetical protein
MTPVTVTKNSFNKDKIVYETDCYGLYLSENKQRVLVFVPENDSSFDDTLITIVEGEEMEETTWEVAYDYSIKELETLVKNLKAGIK